MCVSDHTMDELDTLMSSDTISTLRKRAASAALAPLTEAPSSSSAADTFTVKPPTPARSMQLPVQRSLSEATRGNSKVPKNKEGKRGKRKPKSKYVDDEAAGGNDNDDDDDIESDDEEEVESEPEVHDDYDESGEEEEDLEESTTDESSGSDDDYVPKWKRQGKREPLDNDDDDDAEIKAAEDATAQILITLLEDLGQTIPLDNPIGLKIKSVLERQMNIGSKNPRHNKELQKTWSSLVETQKDPDFKTHMNRADKRGNGNNRTSLSSNGQKKVRDTQLLLTEMEHERHARLAKMNANLVPSAGSLIAQMASKPRNHEQKEDNGSAINKANAKPKAFIFRSNSAVSTAARGTAATAAAAGGKARAATVAVKFNVATTKTSANVKPHGPSTATTTTTTTTTPRAAAATVHNSVSMPAPASASTVITSSSTHVGAKRKGDSGTPVTAASAPTMQLPAKKFKGNAGAFVTPGQFAK